KRRIPVEALPSVEEGELHEENAAGHDGSAFLHEVGASAGGAPGGEQVIYQEYSLARGNRIDVHFHRVGAVLEGVLHSRRQIGQLAWLSNGDKANAEAISQRDAKNEPTSLGTAHTLTPKPLLFST